MKWATNKNTGGDAVVTPNWIGDFVLALAVMHKMPRTPTLIMPPYLLELASALGVSQALAYRRGSPRECKETIRIVRQRRFAHVDILPHSFSSAWFAFRCTIPSRRGVAKELRGPLLTERMPYRLANRRSHLTGEYARVLQAPPFVPGDWQGQSIAGFGKYRDAVVFCPGAKYGPAKRWQGWRDLAAGLPCRQIVILGGAEDAEQCDAIAADRKDACINLAGKTSLVEAARIIAEASVVVSNDSGLMHLAGYLGTPLAAIFGSTSPAWTRPLGSRSQIVYAGEPCSPCFKRTCKYGHYRCLARISAEMVSDSMQRSTRVKDIS
jgi:heptosyltransferase-2